MARTKRFTWQEITEPGEYLRLDPVHDPRWLLEDRGASVRVWRILGDGDADGLLCEYAEP